MTTPFLTYLEGQLTDLEKEGLYKNERPLTSPQKVDISVAEGEVINLCANNYLGFANHPALIEAAKEAADNHGFGMASVRFICGTQSQHLKLEKAISTFLGTEDTILYSSCYDANGGLFETLFGPEDAIISDELNHASIIDGIRLCKAKRYRYKNNDMADLEVQLQQAQKDGARYILIVTDGVFSMDGIIADLKGICDLADSYKALVMVDDSHAVGFMGKNGHGTPEYCGVEGRIDIYTGTLGKALGGASGGYTSGHRQIIDWLRQRSRPYLFSNSLAPMIVAASLKALELLDGDSLLRDKINENTAYFRKAMVDAGFEIVPGDHPIVPVMLGDAATAKKMADRMLEKGIYVTGFSFPVVPRGKARIRTQISAIHERAHLERAVAAFIETAKELGVL